MKNVKEVGNKGGGKEMTFTEIQDVIYNYMNKYENDDYQKCICYKINEVFLVMIISLLLLVMY
jgi:hypothetical protein